jgi:hypothetical protein
MQHPQQGEKQMGVNLGNRTKKIRKIFWGSTIALIAVLVAFFPRLIEAAQGTCKTVRLLTSDFSDANGPYEPQQYLSIKAADVDGDGQDDICYRDVPRTTDPFIIGGGIVCRTSSTGFARSSWSREFASSWSGYEYYWGTIQYPDLNGDGKKDICGRGSAGIICALSNGSSFRMPGTSIFSTGATVWSSTFSDANGWASDPSYWKTIQFPDLNNDGKADVCGRASDGIHCGLSNGTSFDATTRWDQVFTNANAWNSLPGYWSTLRFADVTGDGRPDVCGRGSAGVWCAQNNGSAFTNHALWTTQYSNAFGWNTEKYYATLQLADVNGDGKADICGRGSGGIYCGRSTGTAFADASTLLITDFSDAGGWNNERFYKSIRLVDQDGDGKADVCGRGFAGIHCAYSGWNAQGWPTSGFNAQTGIPNPDPTISFAAVRLVVPNFGDFDGWGASESYWGTVQPHRTAVLRSFGGFPAFPTYNVEWIGRGYDGILISTPDTAECSPTP